MTIEPASMQLPMLGLLRAEWQKVNKNYMLTGFLVWIYPVGLAAFFMMAVLVGLVSDTAQQAMITASSGQWTTDILGIWAVVTSFPANILPRLLPLAFMAVVFASEYQWGMWKNLVPRSRRRSLVLAKFVVLTGVVMLSFLLASLVMGLGQSLTHRVAGVAYGPVLTRDVVAEFIRAYAREALLGLTALVLLAGYAATAALLTRSILGGLLAGFGLSVFEPMSLALLFLLGKLIGQPGITNLYRFTPSYNLDNVRSWLVSHAPSIRVELGMTAEPSLAFSSLMLGAWVVALIILTVWVFERQDITS